MIKSLQQGFVHDWEHRVSLFHAKFFNSEAKLLRLSLEALKHIGEDLDTYVRRSHERTLGYYNPVFEEIVLGGRGI